MPDDYEAIRQLCYRYTFLLDEGDFAGVAAMLADGALRPVMPGVAAEPIRGAAAIERFYADQVVTYRDGDPRTRHLISNQLIDLADDGLSAASRCYFTVLQRPPGRPYALVVGGQYHDRFVKVDGTWRFAEKAIQVDHLNDIEYHFRISAPHDGG
jgi:3-phenylpropionate/cinnamic acid dioxygenase small subunit